MRDNFDGALFCLCRFLGFVNSIGTAFEAPTLATGLGGYIAQVFHPPTFSFCYTQQRSYFFVVTIYSHC